MEIDRYIIKYLRRLTKPFAEFLGRNISKLDRENWWQENVIAVFSERDRIRINEYNELEDFDLSDLFKILFANWNMLKHQNFHLFMQENREIFNQMLGIRIDLAHQKLLPILNNEDAFKYLDAISEFAILINAERVLCNATRYQLMNLLEEKVLKNAYKNGSEHIKKIVSDTRLLLEQCDTALKIEFFYWNNIIDNEHGWAAHNLLVSENLTTFESIRGEFYSLCTGEHNPGEEAVRS
jgi:hypothetical protein